MFSHIELCKLGLQSKIESNLRGPLNGSGANNRRSQGLNVFCTVMQDELLHLYTEAFDPKLTTYGRR